MKITAYILASAVVFAVVAFVHLLRLIQGWPVDLGTVSIPAWVSGVALVLSGGLAGWGFSFLRKT